MSNDRDRDRQPKRVLQLMLIEDDPIFRLGLVACLQPFPDLHVAIEAESTAQALQLLSDRGGSTPRADSPTGGTRALNLIILNLDLGQTTSSQSIGFTLCQQLRAQYPQIPVLLLGSTLELTRLAAAFQSGAGGYCLKGTGVTELVTAIRQVAAGQPYWTEGMQAIAQSLQADQLAIPIDRPVPTAPLPVTTPHLAPVRPTLLAVWRQNTRRTGLRQIERAIAVIEAQRQYPDQSRIDRWFLAGQRRELLAARWLVKRLLPTATAPTPTASAGSPGADSDAPTPDRPILPSTSAMQAKPTSTVPALTPIAAPGSLQSPQATLFQTTVNQLQSSLQNRTTTTLEIDILKESKKRELLATVLRKLQEILDDLRLSQLPMEQVQAKHRVILEDLWQAVVTDFFGKYYTLQVGTQPIDVVDLLLRDRALIQTEILDDIPLFTEFLSHLLFQTPLTVDDTAYAAGTVEASTRMELLLQNLMIQVANAVIQPLLNRLGDVVAIKQTFYDKRLLSSREIERFRNYLSWKYRVERLIKAPTAIFESQFRLFGLSDEGITQVSIYAPRNDELAQLSGIPFVVVLALETRDAIAPRLRAALSFFGKGIVYVLTEVIGRSIGLVGRGIIKGIGNALQDTRPNRSSERWR